MAKQSRSKTAEAASSVYKTSRRWESNRKARLERALKEQPNNAEQIKRAIKAMVYRRRAPTNRVWPARWVKVAKLFKEFTGRFDPNIMSSNPETARNALQGNAGVLQSVKLGLAAPMSEKVFFQLGTRVNLKKAT
jgi:hypothetical protein